MILKNSNNSYLSVHPLIPLYVERLPLFDRKIVNKLAEQRLEAVAQALKVQIEREPEPGFMTGLAGQAIFLYSYSRSCGSSRYENLGFLALERALGMINDGFSWPSFAAGLAGIRFTLRYLAGRGYISNTDGAALDELEPIFQEFAGQRFLSGDYDFLHGALGMFIGNMQNPGIKRQLNGYLAKLAVPSGNGLHTWEARNPKTGVPEINLGLAHGIPSILWFLSHSADPGRDIALLAGGVDYLLSCRLGESANGSLFPHRLVGGKPDQSGRLAWCYGDPGIGAALWQIGSNSNRPDWKADSIGILHKAASRRDAAANRVTDACICHGTAGLALLFYKMALVTGHDELLEAAGHWTRATLDHGRNPDAAAGYLFLTTGDRYVPGYSLLEGITGVGLTLLALLDSESLGWEQGLLL